MTGNGGRGNFLTREVGGNVFLWVNLALFGLMCYYVYWDWLTAIKKKTNVLEFFVYATLILIAIFTVKRILRGMRVPVWILLMAEIGLAMNFIGGLGMVDGKRVFDTFWLGVRYDKYVHCFNGMAGALYLARFRWPFEKRSPLAGYIMVFIAIMGFGAVVEVVEYGIVCNVPRNGVGDYDNNMQDMIANGVGAIAGAVLMRAALKSSEIAEESGEIPAVEAAADD